MQEEPVVLVSDPLASNLGPLSTDKGLRRPAHRQSSPAGLALKKGD